MSTATDAPAKSRSNQKRKVGSGGGGGGRSLKTREEDYSAWYQEVIAAADLVDGSPVKGCMVIKPNGMALWDAIRTDLDSRIRASGAQNAYFPLFIPVSFLSKEAEHVEGFAKASECMRMRLNLAALLQPVSPPRMLMKVRVPRRAPEANRTFESFA